MEKRRYDQLDALRGLAALCVIGTHCISMVPGVNASGYNPHRWFLDTPLSALWAGYEAVIFFFVLSGFVLYLPFERSSTLRYREFLVRRVCRIYLPYLGAILVALAVHLLTNRLVAPNVDTWFNAMEHIPLSFGLILQHVLFLGSYNTNALDPVIWSLIVELRVSIIFPLIVLLVTRFGWRAVLFTCLLITAVTYAGFHYTINHPNLDTELITVEYIPMFLVGALLAKHRDSLANWMRLRTRAVKWLILIACLLMYTYRHWMPPVSRILHVPVFQDWVVTAAVVLIIVLALGSARLAAMLQTRPILQIGKMSYSIYLYHFLILYAVTYDLIRVVPLWTVWGITFTLTLGIAYAAYRFIEMPSIKLGQRINKAVVVRKKDLEGQRRTPARST